MAFERHIGLIIQNTLKINCLHVAFRNVKETNTYFSSASTRFVSWANLAGKLLKVNAC